MGQLGLRIPSPEGKPRLPGRVAARSLSAGVGAGRRARPDPLLPTRGARRGPTSPSVYLHQSAPRAGKARRPRRRARAETRGRGAKARRRERAGHSGSGGKGRAGPGPGPRRYVTAAPARHRGGGASSRPPSGLRRDRGSNAGGAQLGETVAAVSLVCGECCPRPFSLRGRQLWPRSVRLCKPCVHSWDLPAPAAAPG